MELQRLKLECRSVVLAAALVGVPLKVSVLVENDLSGMQEGSLKFLQRLKLITNCGFACTCLVIKKTQQNGQHRLPYCVGKFLSHCNSCHGLGDAYITRR